MDTLSKEKYLSKNIIILNIFFALFIIAVIVYYNLSLKDSLDEFVRENNKILNSYIEREKEAIKSEVNDVVNYINYEKKLAEQRVKDELSLNSENAVNVSLAIYKKSTRSDLITKKEIISILKTMNASDTKHSFFIYEIKNSKNIIGKYIPDNSIKEGLNCINDIDANDNKIVQKFYDIIKLNENGFIKYTQLKTVNDVLIKQKKLTHLNYFKPYSWIIGYSRDIKDMDKEVKDGTIDMLKVKSISSEKKRVTIFKVEKNDRLKLLMAPLKGNEEIAYLKKQYQNTVNKDMLNRGIVFKEYKVDDDINNVKKENIAYFYLHQDWQWLISSGVDIDKVKKDIDAKRKEIEDSFSNRLKESLWLGLLILVVVSAISFILIKLVRKIMTLHNKEIITKDSEIEKKDKINYNYHKQLQENRSILEDAIRKKRLIFSNSKIAFVFLDKNFKIVEVNAGFYNLFAYSEKEIIGRNLEELYPDSEDFEKFKDEVNTKIDHGSMLDLEQNLKDKTKQVKFCHITGSIVIEKSVEYIVLAILDISFKKQIHNNIASLKHNKHIKNEFISNISHDLKTPLNAIKGFAELLDSENLNPTQRKYLESIKMSGDNLLLIINDIIDISLLEHKKITLLQTSIDLEYFFGKVRDIFIQKIRQKGLEFEIEINKNVPRFIVTDQTRLRQIIINLINNSIKYTDKGFVKIAVTSKIDQLFIKIVDSGRGITKENQEKLIEAVEDESKEDAEILGIGFSIVKKLTKLLNCKIKMESVENKGTTITLVCPIDLKKIKSHDKLEKTKFTIDKKSDKKAGDNSIAYNDLDIIWQLEELKNSNLYKNNLEILNFKECKDFARKVYQIGKKFNNKEVLDYSKNLADNINSYDVENIQTDLEQFEELLKRI